jgi:hypothetical protein
MLYGSLVVGGWSCGDACCPFRSTVKEAQDATINAVAAHTIKLPTADEKLSDTLGPRTQRIPLRMPLHPHSFRHAMPCPWPLAHGSDSPSSFRHHQFASPPCGGPALFFFFLLLFPHPHPMFFGVTSTRRDPNRAVLDGCSVALLMTPIPMIRFALQSRPLGSPRTAGSFSGWSAHRTTSTLISQSRAFRSCQQ